MKPGDSPIDTWTIPHALSGLVLAQCTKLKPVQVLMILAGYEYLESVLRNVPGNDGRNLFEHESAANIFADVAAGMIGYYVGRKYGTRFRHAR